MDLQFISNGTVYVESFFVMSGLLVSLSLLRQLDRSRGSFNIFRYYLHRYIRWIMRSCNCNWNYIIRYKCSITDWLLCMLLLWLLWPICCHWLVRAPIGITSNRWVKLQNEFGGPNCSTFTITFPMWKSAGTVHEQEWQRLGTLRAKCKCFGSVRCSFIRCGSGIRPDSSGSWLVSSFFLELLQFRSSPFHTFNPLFFYQNCIIIINFLFFLTIFDCCLFILELRTHLQTWPHFGIIFIDRHTVDYLLT